MQGEQPDLVRSLKEPNGFDNNDAFQRPTSMNLAKSKTSRLQMVNEVNDFKQTGNSLDDSDDEGNMLNAMSDDASVDPGRQSRRISISKQFDIETNSLVLQQISKNFEVAKSR